MRQITKRILAFMLVFAMVLGNMSMVSFAEETQTESIKLQEGNEVSKIDSTIMFAERMNDDTLKTHVEEMRANASKVVDVSYSDGVITVNADVSGMGEIKSSTNGSDNELKYFPILVNFENTEVLAKDGESVFATCDVEDADECGGTEGESAILWINGSSRQGQGTVVTDLVFKGTNGSEIETKLVVNDTATPVITNASPIEYAKLFENGSEDDYAEMRYNQKFVEKVSYDAVTKTITVEADMSEMKEVTSTTNGTSARYFAIMVDFNNTDVLYTATNEPFEPQDVTAADECGGTEGKSAILWINGSNEYRLYNTEGYTSSLDLRTKDAIDKSSTYNLCVKETVKTVEVTGASKVESGSEDVEIPEALSINQEYIKSVNYDEQTNTITVNADISKMNKSVSSTLEDKAEKEYFAIMVDFNDVNLLTPGDIFAECDIKAAKDLKMDNSSILWIDGSTKKLCSGEEGETNYSDTNNKTLELMSKNGNVKSEVKLVINETGEGVKVEDASEITSEEMFPERTDNHAIAMRKNQDCVTSVDYDEENKTITVLADMTEMDELPTDPTNATEENTKKWFAIMVDFEDVTVVETGDYKVFQEVDVRDAQLCGGSDKKSAILWINGTKRQGKDNIGEDDKIVLKSTDDGKEYTYKLHVKEVHNIPTVESVNTITSEEMFPERTDEHAEDMRGNQKWVQSVELDEDNKTITVEADIENMALVESSAGYGINKYFAIMVNFESTKILRTNNDDVFRGEDVTDAKCCNGTDGKSAILWINGSKTEGDSDDLDTERELKLYYNKDDSDYSEYTLKLVQTHMHNLEKVEAEVATCDEDGVKEHYICIHEKDGKACGKRFKDAEGKYSTTYGKMIIPASHDLEKHAAKAATCTKEGNIEYYVCKKDSCKKIFNNADGDSENEIKLADTVIPAKGHKVVKVSAVAATCTKTGNKEHYKCSACGELYTDAAGKNVTTKAAMTIASHTRTKVAAKAATYVATGNKEYYRCSCGRLYSDAAGTKATTLAAVTTAKLVLGKTSKVSIGTRKKDSLKLSWNKVTGATGYRVYIKKSGKWVALKTLTGTSYKATKLSAGVKYTFAIKAYVTQSGKTVWASEYTSKSGYTRPGKSKITIKSRAKTSVKFTWAKVKGATGYRVYVKKNGKWKILKTQKGRTYTAKGLKRRTKYTFAVKAYTKDGSTTVWSDVQTSKSAKTK